MNTHIQIEKQVNARDEYGVVDRLTKGASPLSFNFLEKNTKELHEHDDEMTEKLIILILLLVCAVCQSKQVFVYLKRS